MEFCLASLLFVQSCFGQVTTHLRFARFFTNGNSLTSFITQKFGALKILSIFGLLGIFFFCLLMMNGRGLSSVVDYAKFSDKYLNSFLANAIGLRPILENQQLNSESVYKKIMIDQLIWQHDAYTYKWLSLVYFFAVLGLILPQFYPAKNPVFGQKDQ